MADDVTLDAMSGGSVIATDEIASKHYQRVKLIHGADGVNAGDVSSSNGLPVQVLSIAAGDNNIGNVDIVSSALPTGASTAALQTTGNTALSAIQTAVEIIDNAISGSEMQVDIVSSALPTGAATEATLSSLNGKVTACNTGAVVVSSSALPSGASTAAKQPALGTAGTASTDVITVQGITSMTPLLVNGSGVTQPVSGTVSVSGTVTVGSHAVTNAGTFAVQVTSIAAGDNNIGNVDVVTLPSLPAGTNNIGDVDVLSLPALAAGTNNIGDVDVLTQPARSRTVDAIAVAEQTDAIMNGLTALTPKFAKISAAASGDNTLVAAVTSKKIRVLSLFMMSAGTVSAYIRDDAGTPVNLIGDATNKLTLEAGSGFVLNHNPVGWIETTSGEGLQLNLSGAIGVAGCLTYIEV
jgi:hypothetical protein